MVEACFFKNGYRSTGKARHTRQVLQCIIFTVKTCSFFITSKFMSTLISLFVATRCPADKSNMSISRDSIKNTQIYQRQRICHNLNSAPRVKFSILSLRQSTCTLLDKKKSFFFFVKFTNSSAVIFSHYFPRKQIPY